MTADETGFLLQNLYQATLVPVHVYRTGAVLEHVESFCMYGEDIEEWKDVYELFMNHLPSGFSGSCILYNDREFENILYGMLRRGETVYLIGPSCKKRMPYSYIHQYITKYSLKGVEIPFCNRSIIKSTLILLGRLIYNETEIPVNQIMSRPPEAPEDEYEQQQYHLNRMEENITHHSYQLEETLQQIFMEGDEEKLLDYIRAMPYGTEGMMANTYTKQEEYGAVIWISLVARFAIRAGVDQYLAYNLNDIYLQKISAVSDTEKYSEISLEASRHFLREVRKEKDYQTTNYYVKKCKEYIYKHLNVSFKNTDMAEEIGVSPEYLSQVFSDNQGETIRSCLLRKRIEASQNMLKFSDYHISQIAEYFCFSSQSHFGAVFKKYTGMSPSVYRQQFKQY